MLDKQVIDVMSSQKSLWKVYRLNGLSQIPFWKEFCFQIPNLEGAPLNQGLQISSL